mmetsp:Transcript_23739/g.68316  ORF Transcript_23739/g.68316 Transcript_23739/m.68316 type:complete len:201 (+) Transcript_23739:1486-2088(+)
MAHLPQGHRPARVDLLGDDLDEVVPERLDSLQDHDGLRPLAKRQHLYDMRAITQPLQYLRLAAHAVDSVLRKADDARGALKDAVVNGLLARADIQTTSEDDPVGPKGLHDLPAGVPRPERLWLHKPRRRTARGRKCLLAPWRRTSAAWQFKRPIGKVSVASLAGTWRIAAMPNLRAGVPAALAVELHIRQVTLARLRVGT